MTWQDRLRRWLGGSRDRRRRARVEGRYVPIEDYAVIGDRVSLALVSRHGSIDWACFPRLDSPSVFGRLLDANKGGYWSILPEEPFEATRRYVPDTNVLETTFRTAGGEATLTDFMPPHVVEIERLGDCSIFRIVRVVAGRMAFRVHFEPRFDYARATAEWQVQPGSGVRAAHFDQTLTLTTSVPMEAEGDAATGTIELAAGEQTVLAASYRRPGSYIWRQSVEDLGEEAQRETERYWRTWIERCQYDGPYQEMVRRSALVIRLLDYAPTGAIAAAATTSLPETVGGIRNWDYRYSWIRDASFTLYSFFVLGYPEEGENYLSWILDMTRGQPRSLKVLYGIGGEQENVEFELHHLEGYKGSRPVRVGNGAQNQRQHDIYGELLDSAHLLHRYGGSISDDLWPLLRAIVDWVCEVWRDPDHGLWEVRAGPRHFVYSKVMSWVAVDRGIRLASSNEFECDLDRWKQTRDEIKAEVLEKGWSEERQAFTQAYGYESLDASLLALPLRRFIDAEDPRMKATVQRIREELKLGGTDHLFWRVSPEFEDGLRGREGAFMMVSFWLVDCLTQMGEMDEAQRILERLFKYSNDVGLYAEMVDPNSGRHLGNFPQAFTHVALINAAHHLALARKGQRDTLGD